MAKVKRKQSSVVPVLRLRNQLGSLIREVSEGRRSLVIAKRGMPQAVLLSIQEYVRLRSPELPALREIGEQSKKNGTDKLTDRQINKIIAEVRAKNKKRR